MKHLGTSVEPKANWLLPHFPWGVHPDILPNQEEALRFAAKNDVSIQELPTGSGKTAIAYAYAKALAEKTGRVSIIVVPNKTLVNQFKAMFPDVAVAYGRNEHDCLYYPDEETVIKADEIPCAMLVDCPHRVNQDTGNTHEPGATACPYLLQKYQARKEAKIVVCTVSFYLFVQLFNQSFGEVGSLTIDEAHQVADIVRRALSYDITDWHLGQAVALLAEIGEPEAAKHVKAFLKKMISIIKRKPSGAKTIISDSDISTLLQLLATIDDRKVYQSLKQAVRNKVIDPKERREVLTKVEMLIRDLRRYGKSFQYALDENGHSPLNYLYAYWDEAVAKKIAAGESDKRVSYRLTVKCYYVAPLIKKLLVPHTLCLSATIGDPDTFAFETGIRGPFQSLGSEFPEANTRIFLPTDTPNLAQNARSDKEPTRVLRRIAKACRQFADQGHRSFVLLISNVEIEKFCRVAIEEGVEFVTYGDDITPRQAAEIFKGGHGDVLVGTTANYGQGIDLPKQIAPVMFFLRPGYPSPTDPATMFEERRFGRQRWAIWNWRVMIQALQARGRNVRSSTDIGVCFFISQQFGRFLYASLPKWLQPAYRYTKTFEECIEETEELLSLKKKV